MFLSNNSYFLPLQPDMLPVQCWPFHTRLQYKGLDEIAGTPSPVEEPFNKYFFKA